MISFQVITVANGGCMARPPEISLTHGFMHSVSALTQVTTFWAWFVVQDRSGTAQVMSLGEDDFRNPQNCIKKGGFSSAGRHF